MLLHGMQQSCAAKGMQPAPTDLQRDVLQQCCFLLT